MYRYTDTSHDAREMYHRTIGTNEPARRNNTSVLEGLQRTLHRPREMIHPPMLVAAVGAQVVKADLCYYALIATGNIQVQPLGQLIGFR